MTDFMDTALNYQPGDWVARNANHWVITNGIGRIPVCDVCAQPIYEGHIDCTCDKNHPEICDRPTYDQLKAQHDALLAALEDAATWLHLVSQNHGTSPLITKRHQVEAAKIEAALEQVK